MAGFVDEIEVVESAFREVVREPLAPGAEAIFTGLIERLDVLLRSPELAKVRQLPSPQRASIARGFQHLADNLRIMQDVGEQVERLGGDAPRALTFADAVARMERQLRRRGLRLAPSKASPPTVFRDPATGELRLMLRRLDATTIQDALKAQVEAIKQAAKDEIAGVNKGLAAALRDNALEQYITVAVQSARLSKLEEDEGWFAEIDGFPGVWADGASPEESRTTLAEVLRDWLTHKIACQDPDIPVVANIDLAALARGG